MSNWARAVLVYVHIKQPTTSTYLKEWALLAPNGSAVVRTRRIAPFSSAQFRMCVKHIENDALCHIHSTAPSDRPFFEQSEYENISLNAFLEIREYFQGRKVRTVKGKFNFCKFKKLFFFSKWWTRFIQASVLSKFAYAERDWVIRRQDKKPIACMIEFNVKRLHSEQSIHTQVAPSMFQCPLFPWPVHVIYKFIVGFVYFANQKKKTHKNASKLRE